MNIVSDFLVALLVFSILLVLCLLWLFVWLDRHGSFTSHYYEDYAGFHEVTYSFWWGFVRKTDTIWDWDEWMETNYNEWNREFLDETDGTPFDHRRYPR